MRGRGIPAATQLRFPPRTYVRRRTKGDVREPPKRSRRSCRVAMSTYEETGRSEQKSERCVILAVSPWVIHRRSLAGARRENRSWRTNRTTRHVGSVALVIFPSESTGHTGRKPTSAKLLNAAPLWETLLGNLRAGIFPLRRTANEGRGKTWASMLLQ